MGAGIIGGLGLILVEILYHKHKIRKEKRADAAQMAITKWKGTIEVSSVPDPDPHVFVPPGSGSISRRHGSADPDPDTH